MVDRDASLEWFLANRHAEISLFVMFLDPTPSCPAPGTAEFEAVLREHFVFWWELEESGVLLGAGPIERETGMAGMAILRVANREAAERGGGRALCPTGIPQQHRAPVAAQRGHARRHRAIRRLGVAGHETQALSGVREIVYGPRQTVSRGSHAGRHCTGDQDAG